jgi:hypothetical protein
MKNNDEGKKNTGRKTGKKTPRLTESEKKAGRAFSAEQAKTWRYVGRFMSHFAAVEGGVDRALLELFDLKPTLFFLLTGDLDLRKKLTFVEVAMERQGIRGSKVVKKIHELHDIRNLLAHNQFFPSDDGIQFEYVRRGKFGHPKFEAKVTTFLGNFISYSQLNSYSKDMSHIEDELIRIGASLTPITGENEDFARDVEKIIEASSNIRQFPRRPKKK